MASAPGDCTMTSALQSFVDRNNLTLSYPQQIVEQHSWDDPVGDGSNELEQLLQDLRSAGGNYMNMTPVPFPPSPSVSPHSYRDTSPTYTSSVYSEFSESPSTASGGWPSCQSPSPPSSVNSAAFSEWNEYGSALEDKKKKDATVPTGGTFYGVTGAVGTNYSLGTLIFQSLSPSDSPVSAYVQPLWQHIGVVSGDHIHGLNHCFGPFAPGDLSACKTLAAHAQSNYDWSPSMYPISNEFIMTITPSDSPGDQGDDIPVSFSRSSPGEVDPSSLRPDFTPAYRFPEYFADGQEQPQLQHPQDAASADASGLGTDMQVSMGVSNFTPSLQPQRDPGTTPSSVRSNDQDVKRVYRGHAVQGAPSRKKTVRKRRQSTEKVFPCPYPGCAKAFARSHNTTVHYNSVHLKKRMYLCDLDDCPKAQDGYSRQHDLNRHYLQKHPARTLLQQGNGQN